MLVSTIVKNINQQLADEQFPYSQLERFMDAVIDDINDTLNSCFPTFGELREANDNVPPQEYNYFPDKYLRSVLVKGAAYKYYIMDEEGMATAEAYNYEYADALFRMQRDYQDLVPEEYQADRPGAVDIAIDNLDCYGSWLMWW